MTGMNEAYLAMQNIYEHLGDETSKRIFLDCINYNLSDDENIIMQSLKKHVFPLHPFHISELMERHVLQEKIIFGAGVYGKFLQQAFPEYKWSCYVDNNYKNIHEEAGLPVISFDELCEKHKNSFIVLSSLKKGNEMKQQALDAGFSEKNLWDFGKSVDLLQGEQYFSLDELWHDKDEIFVDVGVYDGLTTKKFINWSNGQYNHVYLFEANRELYENSVNNLSNEKNCTLFHYGLGSKNERKFFYESPKDKEFVGDLNEYEFFDPSKDDLNQWKRHEVSVVTLDEMLLDERITFIKMDIEGAEGDALMGAQKVIEKYKPKLAISAYHRKDDLWALPSIILSARKDYTFYLRYYYINCRCGAVLLYAI